MKTTTQWKFLVLIDGQIKSVYGDCTWKIGEWQKPVKDLCVCNRGYHSSATIPEAHACVRGDILAQVECKGKKETFGIKDAWENQRIVKAYRITWAAIDKYFLRALEVSLEENPEQENAKEIAEAIAGIKQGVIRSTGWTSGSSAGVWCVNLNFYRTNTNYYVGFRCACSRLQQVWAEDILPGLEEVTTTPESEK